MTNDPLVDALILVASLALFFTLLGVAAAIGERVNDMLHRRVPHFTKRGKVRR